MAVTYNAEEIFEMAVQLERNGAKFYRAAAEKLPAVRQVLIDLAAMEDEHEKTFTNMREQLSDQGEVVFDPEGEAQMYLDVMVEGQVFDVGAEPAGLFEGEETAEDILETAIGKEKESIAFYAGLKECVPPRAGRDKVEAIIREEFGHIATLSEQLSALK
ncbi:MAG: rubrerythrin [Phycisphaerae bacterium]|nr:ferritin family protein [Phycisphaerae bacterium]NIP53552.1 ferritin family protein [Phycisphaerae bacterium]NIS52516.1 ferritin family protein [Phycisphaerae bacterium]NIU07393.1 ferritin family protein [Phycisphaerae bacterium]NIU54978.1 rubrerythrin [Phycisphaerae bacterium]